jgi:hypothetical protein
MYSMPNKLCQLGPEVQASRVVKISVQYLTYSFIYTFFAQQGSTCTHTKSMRRLEPTLLNVLNDDDDDDDDSLGKQGPSEEKN